MRPAFAARASWILLLVACGTSSSGTPGTGPSGGGPSPTTVTGSPPAQPPIACRTDLDCVTCPERGCTCGVAATCPPQAFGCAGDPCTNRSARCHQGHCALVRVAARPCGTDADCESRPDDCSCGCVAALRSATSAEMPVCTHACGTRPRCQDIPARCEPTTHRCYLDWPR